MEGDTGETLGFDQTCTTSDPTGRTSALLSLVLRVCSHNLDVLQKLQECCYVKMAKRPATTWNALSRKKRKTMKKLTMAQLPAAARPETKFKDFSGTAAANDQLIMNLILLQGDDGDDFVGSQVHLRALDFSVRTTQATNLNACRVSILIPKDPTVAPTGLRPTLRYGHREFTILYDEFFTENEKNGTRIKLDLGMVQRYNALGTAVTQNNLYIAVNTYDTVALINADARLYYTDA